MFNDDLQTWHLMVEQLAFPAIHMSAVTRCGGSADTIAKSV